MSKYILNALVENHAGILAKMASLFARRGFNIDSLAVGETHDPKLSSATIVVDGDAQTVDQVEKQLSKLIDVISVQTLAPEASVSRELSLIKVSCTAKNRAEITQIVDIFRANIIDISDHAVIIELTGSAMKIEAFKEMMRPYNILEMSRTGMIAMTRSLADSKKVEADNHIL
ncbi:MAG: acetolactate synthase small subunit [Clostridia bacterium]|nr:acetolactate synthase small subunit [Clostridia bacterium]